MVRLKKKSKTLTTVFRKKKRRSTPNRIMAYFKPFFFFDDCLFHKYYCSVLHPNILISTSLLRLYQFYINLSHADILSDILNAILETILMGISARNELIQFMHHCFVVGIIHLVYLTNFFENLLFLTPGYANVRVHIRQ